MKDDYYWYNDQCKNVDCLKQNERFRYTEIETAKSYYSFEEGNLVLEFDTYYSDQYWEHEKYNYTSDCIKEIVYQKNLKIKSSTYNGYVPTSR